VSRILIVDDEQSLREFLEILLTSEGYAVDMADCGFAAIAKISSGEVYDLIITDLKMARGDGLQVLAHVKKNVPEIEVIMMTAFSTSETAVEAMKLGAYDYLAKPFNVDEITLVVAKCLEKRNLAQENQRLKSELADRYSFENIVGKSAAMKQVFSVVERVASTRTSVLVTGETGTGKELVARAVHFASSRCDKPFLVINCGAIPEQLMESELFGHKKGSFTGAFADKTGMFEAAEGGTLFLDEVGELPMSLQVKLLRVLQERRVKPVGGAHEIQVNARIIAATNRDLEEEVEGDRFRRDLFYRLNVIQIAIPPLRDRREDVPLLVQHFIHKFNDEMDKQMVGTTPEALDSLMAWHYPGNVRELENIIERAATFETTDRLQRQNLPPSVAEPRVLDISAAAADFELPEEGVVLEDILSEIERRYLRQALERSDGVRTDAAKLLGMTFRSIRYKLSKYGMNE
jgi:two-component system response regulator PilR (NtrC family)